MKKKQTLSYYLLTFALFTVVGCSHLPEAATIDLEHYEPVGKFVPAYEALTNRTDLATNQDYDIEQTVRESWGTVLLINFEESNSKRKENVI